MFQFQLRVACHIGETRTEPRVGQAETGFDDGELATWFVQPDSWLQTKRPLDLLDSAGHLLDIFQDRHGSAHHSGEMPRRQGPGGDTAWNDG